MVAIAQEPEDNLRVLSLIPRARAGAGDHRLLHGPGGQVVPDYRAVLGSFLTFAPFTKKGASAPGQLTVNEVKRLWQMLKR